MLRRSVVEERVLYQNNPNKATYLWRDTARHSPDWFTDSLNPVYRTRWTRSIRQLESPCGDSRETFSPFLCRVLSRFRSYLVARSFPFSSLLGTADASRLPRQVETRAETHAVPIIPELGNSRASSGCTPDRFVARIMTSTPLTSRQAALPFSRRPYGKCFPTSVPRSRAAYPPSVVIRGTRKMLFLRMDVYLWRAAQPPTKIELEQ